MIGYQQSTATAMATATATVTAVAWRCVQAGLWVASGQHGEPLGIVSESWGRGFTVTTASGLDLGMHASLVDAKAALEHAG